MKLYCTHPLLFLYAYYRFVCMFIAYANTFILFLHRAFYLDKSNLSPSSAPKAAFIDKVCVIAHYSICRGSWEISVYECAGKELFIICIHFYLLVPENE